MVPQQFYDFFAASAGAGAALVGLLFVAISIAPERIVAPGAPTERQAVAASAFTALANAFFISLAALIPRLNIGAVALVMSTLALTHSLALGWRLLVQRGVWHDRLGVVRRLFLVLVSVILYGYELWYSIVLTRETSPVPAVSVLATIVLSVYGLGLTRAWELLGARRGGLFGWLSVLHEIEDDGPKAQARQATPVASAAHPSAAPAAQRPLPPNA